MPSRSPIALGRAPDRSSHKRHKERKLIVVNANERRILRLKEAADELGCSTMTLRRAIHSGELPASRLGQNGRYRVRREDLEQYLRPVEAR